MRTLLVEVHAHTFSPHFYLNFFITNHLLYYHFLEDNPITMAVHSEIKKSLSSLYSISHTFVCHTRNNLSRFIIYYLIVLKFTEDSSNLPLFYFLLHCIMIILVGDNSDSEDEYTGWQSQKPPKGLFLFQYNSVKSFCNHCFFRLGF